MILMWERGIRIKCKQFFKTIGTAERFGRHHALDQLPRLTRAVLPGNPRQPSVLQVKGPKCLYIDSFFYLDTFL